MDRQMKDRGEREERDSQTDFKRLERPLFRLFVLACECVDSSLGLFHIREVHEGPAHIQASHYCVFVTLR